MMVSRPSSAGSQTGESPLSGSAQVALPDGQAGGAGHVVDRAAVRVEDDAGGADTPPVGVRQGEGVVPVPRHDAVLVSPVPRGRPRGRAGRDEGPDLLPAGVRHRDARDGGTPPGERRRVLHPVAVRREVGLGQVQVGVLHHHRATDGVVALVLLGDEAVRVDLEEDPPLARRGSRRPGHREGLRCTRRQRRHRQGADRAAGLAFAHDQRRVQRSAGPRGSAPSHGRSRPRPLAGSRARKRRRRPRARGRGSRSRGRGGRRGCRSRWTPRPGPARPPPRRGRASRERSRVTR